MPQYELNLRDYLRIYHKRKWLIFTTIILVLGATMSYLSGQVPIYQAQSTVKIEERKTVAGLLTEWIAYTPADIMESQSMLIKGFQVMRKVALRLGLISESLSTEEIYKIVRSLQGKISVARVGATNIIEITVTSSKPEEARNLANIVAEAYIEENLIEKKKQARAARNFIEEQLTSLKERLMLAEERLRAFGDEVKGISLAEPIQNKLIELEFELAALTQRYTEKHPRILKLKEQIKEIEAQLEGFSGKQLEYSRLGREVEVNRKLYTLLSEELEKARITEAQKIGDASLVDPAVLPTTPIGPQKSSTLLIGALAGILLGFVLAFISESLDTSIGTIEDVESVVKLPVLGVVPSVYGELELRPAKGILKKLRFGLGSRKKSEIEERYIRLLTHFKPKSPVAESYRNIRTNLKLSHSKRSVLITSAAPEEGKTTILVNLALAIAQTGAKVLLVSSDLRRPAIAKTFGIKREPGISEVVEDRVTLDDALRDISDIMLGEMNLEEITHTPDLENIHLLLSGHIPTNPSELLESKEMAKLMDELNRHDFDVILYDSPPVLPVTDAVILAAKVDTVVIVYEIGRTARSTLLRAKTQLEAGGANISGVLLNHIQPQTEALSPYPYYKYKKYKYYAEERQRAGGKKEAEI